MKKKSFLLTLLSVIMVAALSVPAFWAFADGTAAPATTGEKIITVKVYDNNPAEVDLVSATEVEEGGITVIRANQWGGSYIMLKSPVDLSGTTGAKLYFEFKTLSTSSWGTVNAVVANGENNDKVSLNGDGGNIGIYADYTVVNYDLSVLTSAQLAQFKGLAIGSSGEFYVKKVWVEYDNPDYSAGPVVDLIEDSEFNNATAGNTEVTLTVSADKEITLTAPAAASPDGNFTKRIIGLSKKSVTDALFNEGVITFDYKTTQAESFDLRLMNDGESAQYGEYYYVIVPVTVIADGEWHTATVNVSEFYGKTVSSTWGGIKDGVLFNTEAVSAVGFGLDKGTVTIKGIKATYDNKNRTISGIEIGGTPKTDYISGEKFDAAGMTVKIVFSDGFKLDCYGYAYDKDLVLTTANDKMTVSWTYKGHTYTADLDITVTSEYTGIVIKNQPDKTSYKAGEKFSTDGMKVVAVKHDNTEIEIVDYEYYQGMLAPGTTGIELSYSGLKTTVDITVAQFGNSLSVMSRAFAEDGEPNYGWSAQVASVRYVSQATYDAASEDEKTKMCVTPKDDEKGYYISANFDTNNYATRIFEYGVADYRLGDLYEDESYNAMVSVTYRTTSTFDKPVNFGLANFKDWNLGYHNTDVSAYIVSDGEWHTLYFDIALAYGEIDGMLWDGMTGNVDLNSIVGFAVKSQATGTLDIADVSVKWTGDENAAKAVDTTAPEFTYSGEMTITAKAGDAAPTFADQKARDKNDGYIDVKVEWQDGAVTDGKLNEGTYTVKVYAEDAAGNKTEPYIITVNVEKVETPPGPVDPADPTEPEKSGCNAVKSVSIIITVGLTIGILVTVLLLIKRKRGK